ncbi:MAG: hypothetical protein RIE86_21160 [Imperialibacter sp.]|uniref:hypothetical protein n=1 Tax=Imperialibacter sp. TaxID=2038411 RepID=UPI0032EB8CE9
MKLLQLLSAHFFVTIVLFSASHSYAQEAPVFRRNAIIAELGGTGVFGSISYERRIPLKNGAIFAPSIGIAPAFPEHSKNVDSKFYMIPLQLNWLMGKSTSKLELGFSINPAYTTGVSFANTPEERSHKQVGALPSFRVGYRYMGRKGLEIRAGYTPIIFISPWAGVSLGYSF